MIIFYYIISWVDKLYPKISFQIMRNLLSGWSDNIINALRI